MLQSASEGVVVRAAPAKVNLALHVVGQRADGYHELDTLVVFTRFGDRITVSRSHEAALAVSGPFSAQVPTDGGNLVLGAVEALRGRFDIPPLSITLEKNLPVASGVGGGSSDAAATLHAVVELLRLDATHDALMGIAAALGADVPMCFVAQPAVARGIGETLSPVPPVRALPLLLVNPGTAIATPDVFRALASRSNPPLPPLPRTLDLATLCTWLGGTRNDLEPAAEAIVPSIADALQALRKSGARFAGMSGSGATCFGLFETGNVAKRAAIAIRGSHPEWFVASTKTLASGDSDAGH